MEEEKNDAIERRLAEIETIVGEIRRRLAERYEKAPPPSLLYAASILAIDCPVHGPRTCDECKGSGAYGGLAILEQSREPALACGACNGTGKDPIALAECMCKTTAEALGSDLPTFSVEPVEERRKAFKSWATRTRTGDGGAYSDSASALEEAANDETRRDYADGQQ